MTPTRFDVLRLAQERLQSYFETALPSRFGHSASWMVEERLHAEKIETAGLVEELLRQGCDLTVGYLRQGGSVTHLESLFLSFCCLALERLLEERREREDAELLRLLEGDIKLDSSPLRHDPRVLAKVHTAISRLERPFREFFAADFAEALPESAVRERLGLRDHEEYLQLRRLSLAALRLELARLNRS